ncbi:cysteine hydrolase family protein [Algivirga pacifica]|uniref:Cysteine hydrolase family protein n=1 Tax=Algivirga pacifica TaxID=1162670 RepID=A0ABP9DNC1_9BACT
MKSITLNNNTPPALLLIDIQQGFEDIAYWGGGRNNPQAEELAGKLLTIWRARKWPRFHIQHCSTTPESPLHPSHQGNAFHPAVTPLSDEPIIQKNVNSGFIGTSLKEQLEALNIEDLIIVGLTTDHCVSTTTRMAGNYGYNVYLIEEAIATFDKVGVKGESYPAQLIHDTALASLNGEFGKVISVEELYGVLEV